VLLKVKAVDEVPVLMRYAVSGKTDLVQIKAGTGLEIAWVRSREDFLFFEFGVGVFADFIVTSRR
jgi:hypothetical protein